MRHFGSNCIKALWVEAQSGDNAWHVDSPSYRLIRDAQRKQILHNLPPTLGEKRFYKCYVLRFVCSFSGAQLSEYSSMSSFSRSEGPLSRAHESPRAGNLLKRPCCIGYFGPSALVRLLISEPQSWRGGGPGPPGRVVV